MATPEDTTHQPKIAAMLFRGYLSLFKQRGLLEAMRPRLSPAVQAAMDKPPLPITWMNATMHDELVQAAGQVSSREVVRQCAFENTAQSTGPMVLPMLRTLLKLWGATPASIFENLNSVVTVQAKGVHIEYVPGTETSGTVVIDLRRQTNDYVYAVWEGVLMFVYEVSGTKGEVSRAEVLDGGRRGRIAVRWTPRPGT